MNRKLVLAFALLVVLCLLTIGNSVRFISSTHAQNNSSAQVGKTSRIGDGSTLPTGAIDRERYMPLREEQIARMRGITPGTSLDPSLRLRALAQMNRQETKDAPDVPTWTEIGPIPLPSGDTQDPGVSTPVSGRATSVVVDPTNSNTVYLGTAQGGVWRSTDGGNTWVTIFETAETLSIGAMALAPSSPTTLYVGTGEHPGNFTGDTFFGVGVYRIDNADTTANLVGPINPQHTFTSIFNQPIITTCFGGRAITQILVHPTDPATIFVSTTGAFSGISGLTIGSELPPLGLRGVYRSTNATSAPASVTFQKITVTTDNSFDNPGTGNTAVWDMAFEPGNPNTMLATVAGSQAIGGVLRSTDALSPNPTFTQTLTPPLDPNGQVIQDGLGMKLAVNKTGSVVTVYVTSNETSSCPNEDGRLRKSTDGGVTWSDLPAADGFCGGLCIFGDPVQVDPVNANLVYLGGNARGTCSEVMQRSTDGGATFARDDSGLHSVAHYIHIDPNTVPSTVWVTTNGGVWKRQDATAGTPWINRNNSALGTLQFQSVAVHPVDPIFTIGGVHDNGTAAQITTQGNWTTAEGGDGGYALIDQSATDTTNVTMYHTFFNVKNVMIGFSRTNLGSCLSTKDSWEFRGAGAGVDATPSCDGTAKKATNGINLSDSVNYYAPMALGPGSPNTVYFGTDKLYRSTDRGDTMTAVSQGPLSGTNPISAIGISRQNDKVRIVGTVDGKVFATVTGSSTLTDITPATLPSDPYGHTIPDLKYISRVAIDPNNQNIAYIALSYYMAAGEGIFKTTNLNQTGTGTVTWTAMASGIPSVPINAFVIDPANSSHLFAGTDIGVYSSDDAGATWNPYGSGLPRVAVFDMAIQSPSHTLKIATHGRGMWQIPIAFGPANTISGEILYAINNAKKVPNVSLTLTGNNGFSPALSLSAADGTYSFSVPSGNDYTLTPSKSPEAHDPSITSFDASQAARFALNLVTLTATQQIAADASNNGAVSAFDASLIARYQLGLATPGSFAGTWKFQPASRTFNGLSTDQLNQTFQAILVGDVSGNWVPPAGPAPAPPVESNAVARRAAPAGVVGIPVSLPNKQDSAAQTTIPVLVGDTTGQGIFAFDLDLFFDPAVLQVPASPFDVAGTMSNGWSVNTSTSTDGNGKVHLLLNAFSTSALTGQGTLINLKLNVVGAPNSTTPLTWQSFNFNEGTPVDSDVNGSFTVAAPTAAASNLSGRIVSSNGTAVSGAVVTVTTGQRVVRAITDSEGRYQVAGLESGQLYTVTPSRANYSFAPANRSFSLIGDKTDAGFTASADANDTANPLDTAEYFVRQQYLDLLGREPDQSGFEYWSTQLNQCQGEANCIRNERLAIAGAFFMEREFQDTGSYLYDLYQGVLGRRPSYTEYNSDRQQLVGGAQLEAEKTAFASAFVQRAEFTAKYQTSTTAAAFVDALLAEAQQRSGVDLSGSRQHYLDQYSSGGNMTESRALVVRALADEAAFKQAEYNQAFVLAEYFSYLRRNPDENGYEFWLNVLNTSGGNNYRGMVCAFITSTEYQRRFSTMVTRNDTECGQ